MAFKCQPGLDTCVTVTPGAHPYTSFNKHRAPASFVIQEQCMVSRESRDERRRAPLGPGTRCRARCPACTFLSPASLPLSPGKRFWRGTDHAEPNPSYLAEDHTDGPDWASWTHRQLGVMMHRMLPINRMYCSAEASQADTPDRAAEGGPAKRPERTGGTERRGGARSRGGDSNLQDWVKSWSVGGNDGRRGSEATLWTFNEKKGRGRIRAGWYRRRFEGEEKGDKLCGES